jgi:SPP1 family predicted phage head-tail adaptor
MRAGRMSERVTLLLKSVARDALGGETITWTDQGDVWAEVEQLAGREYFSAYQVNPESTTRFRFRYDDAPTITQAWRLEWRGQQYDIDNVADTRSEKRMWEIMAHTAQA